MKKKAVVNTSIACQTRMMAIRDAMEILSGKWKFHILGTLMQGGKLRFMDLQRELNGISAKMLSKELQDLEFNQLLSRTVLQTKPITVEYEISNFGKTLEPLIDEVAKWGTSYRDQLRHTKNREQDKIKNPS
ncbi:MAG: transcriptional regulator [Bacteroidota bacterium]|jgi:DNA-binding HxlR family transcriptional regulator|nr:transcriptional regulator [Bacteroidota bacterium]